MGGSDRTPSGMQQRRRTWCGLWILTLTLAACDARAPAASDPHDQATMDFKSPPARVTTARHTGAFAAGNALSMTAALKPLDPAPVKELRLDATHKIIEIAPGVRFAGWTFGDQVPGPTIRARVGDKIRFKRILVERLWPRGMRKEVVAADAWMKEVAPSTQLRQWFGHQVERWEEFRRRYREELDAHPGAWEPILDAERRGTVTLLYSAHDVLHNGAVVLRDYLVERQSRRPRHGKRESANAQRADRSARRRAR